MTAPERGACSPTKGSPLLSSWHLAPRLRVPQAGTALEMPSPGVGLQVIHGAQAPLLACQPCRKNLELINSAFRSQQCFPGCSFVARAVLAPAPSASAAADEFPIGKKQKAKKKKQTQQKNMATYANKLRESLLLHFLLLPLSWEGTPQFLHLTMREASWHLQAGLPLRKKGKILKRNKRKAMSQPP